MAVEPLGRDIAILDLEEDLRDPVPRQAGEVGAQEIGAQTVAAMGGRDHDREDLRLVGSAALAVANEAWAIGLDALVIDDSRAPDVTWVARLGLIADPEQAPPRPLYLKAPETTPQDRARLPRR